MREVTWDPETVSSIVRTLKVAQENENTMKRCDWALADHVRAYAQGQRDALDRVIELLEAGQIRSEGIVKGNPASSVKEKAT